MERRRLAGYGSSPVKPDMGAGAAPMGGPQQRRRLGGGPGGPQAPPPAPPVPMGPPITQDQDGPMNPLNMDAFLGGMGQGQQGLDQLQQLLAGLVRKPAYGTP